MIPREIDELMWTIAEGTDHSAIEAFGDRYPNLREELLRRIRTVNALKSGNKSLKSAKVPTFQNTQVRPTNRNFAWASLAFAVIAMFPFGIYRSVSHSDESTTVPVTNIESKLQPNASLEPRPDRSLDPINVPNNQTEGQNKGQVPNQSQPPNFPVYPNQPSNSEKPSSALQTLKLESAPLHTALLLIGEAGHFSISIGPGMPNPIVKLDFVNMDPMDMLKELGRDYAFTPIVDGPHSILILPKKDEDESQITGNG